MTQKSISLMFCVQHFTHKHIKLNVQTPGRSGKHHESAQPTCEREQREAAPLRRSLREDRVDRRLVESLERSSQRHTAEASCEGKIRSRLHVFFIY